MQNVSIMNEKWNCRSNIRHTTGGYDTNLIIHNSMNPMQVASYSREVSDPSSECANVDELVHDTLALLTAHFLSALHPLYLHSLSFELQLL